MDIQTQTTGEASPPSDRMLPFAAARAFVGLSRSTVYELMGAHAFPAPVKVGRNNYFSEHEIQAWITARLKARTDRKSR